MTAQALVKLVITVDGIPELQRTAEGMRRATQSIKETEGAFGDLDRQFRRGVHAPTFAPGWQGQVGGGGFGGMVGAGAGALMGAIRSHPILTIAGGLFAARQAIRSFGEEELTLARTEAILRGQGITDMREAGRVATEMAQKTLPTYREQYEAIGSLMAITRDYREAVEALATVNNIAAITGWDLNTAALAYGNALEGNTEMLGRRYIPALRLLTEEQKKNREVVKGVVAGAISGVAEAQAQTPTGQMIQAKKQINEAMQAIGGVLTTSLAVPARGILSFMKGPESLFDLGGLRESNRVESEAFRRRFFPEQVGAEHAFIARQKSWESTDRDIRQIEVLKRAGRELESQATIMGRIRELQEAIGKESRKEEADFTLIKKHLVEIKDLEEKRKKLNDEIATTKAGPVLGRLGRVGALTGTVAGLGGAPGERIMTPEGPRWTPATGKFALMEKFGGRQLAPGLTLGKALSENQGITGFDMWRQSQLADVLQRKDIPTTLRSQVAGELFQNRLDMMGRATTPEMQAQMFGGAVDLMGLSQRIDEQKAREDIKAREDLIGAVQEGNKSLATLVEIARRKTPVPQEVNFYS